MKRFERLGLVLLTSLFLAAIAWATTTQLVSDEPQTFKNDKTFTDAVIIQGKLTASGGVTQTGSQTFGSITVTGDAGINGDLTLNGDAGILGSLAVSGVGKVAGDLTCLADVIASGEFETSSTTYPQFTCTGAAACGFLGATGQNTTIDCGGTCTAFFGSNSNATSIGQAGKTTSILGSISLGTATMPYFGGGQPVALWSIGTLTFTNAVKLGGYGLSGLGAVGAARGFTLQALTGAMTTAAAGTGSVVVTATDGTNTCTFTGTCAGANPTNLAGTGAFRLGAVNGAGTGCAYAAGAAITASITQSNCGTTTPIGFAAFEGQYQ